MKILVLILHIGLLALAGSVNLTLRISTSDDASSVIGFKAVLYNANNVKIDSIISTNSNQVTFVNVSTEVRIKDVSRTILYEVQQNYPNPFNPTTKIKFSLPHSENVALKIYNIEGKEISSYSGDLGVGTHELEWAPNAAAGIYLAGLQQTTFCRP